MLSAPLVRYILTAALRDRLLITLFVMIACGAGLGVFLGAAAVTEQESFSTVFGAGGLRFLGVTGLILFISFYMRRAFDNKEVEFLLARPLSRLQYLFSHALAFVLLAAFIGCCVSAALMFSGKPHIGGLVVWGFSIVGEYAIMAVAALFFSIMMTSAAGSALAALGFYALARLIGILLGIAKLRGENIFFDILNNAMELISVIVPRLDLLGQTSWLVYGVEGAGGIVLRQDAGAAAVWALSTLGPLGFIAIQSTIFCGLLLTAALFDFRRREF